MLKKAFFRVLPVLLLIPLLFAVLWHIELYFYSPLSRTDFAHIFSNFESYKKKCSHDILFETIHGEVYELHIYKMRGAEIQNDYPMVGKDWGKEMLSPSSQIQRWTNDICGNSLFDTIPESKIKQKFSRYWNNPKCSRSYIFINECKSFWFSYDKEKEEFSYLIYLL